MGRGRVERFDLQPSSPNVKAATKLAARIRQEIELGVFDYAATIPNSAVAPKAIPTFAEYAQTWIDTLTCEKPTADSLLTQSPAAKDQNRKHQRAEIDPFEPEEMAAILTRMAERSPEVVWAYYGFSFNTGLRTSEQIALRWADVDWRRFKIKNANARVRHQIKDTKTHYVREVDLSDRKQREEFFYPVLKALGIRRRRAYNTYAAVALMLA